MVSFVCGWVGGCLFVVDVCFGFLMFFVMFCFLPFVANIISFKTVQTWVETFQEIFTRLNELNIPGNKSRKSLDFLLWFLCEYVFGILYKCTCSISCSNWNIYLW